MKRHSTKEQADLIRAWQSSGESIEAFYRNHLENVSGYLIVFRQAKFPQKSVQNSPSGRGDFLLPFLPHERMLHAIAFPLE